MRQSRRRAYGEEPRGPFSSFFTPMFFVIYCRQKKKARFIVQFKNDVTRSALCLLSAYAGAILWPIFLFQIGWTKGPLVLVESLLIALVCHEGFGYVLSRYGWTSSFDENELRIGKTYGRYESAWKSVLSPRPALFYGAIFLLFVSLEIGTHLEEGVMEAIAVLWLLFGLASLAVVRESTSAALRTAKVRFSTQSGVETGA